MSISRKRYRDTGPSPAQRARVHARSEFCCERCGAWCQWPDGEIHHLRNRSQGVDNSLSGLVDLCKPCHLWVGLNPAQAAAEGFHLQNGDIAGETEILYGGPLTQLYGRRRAVLTDDGNVLYLEEAA